MRDIVVEIACVDEITLFALIQGTLFPGPNVRLSELKGKMECCVCKIKEIK